MMLALRIAIRELRAAPARFILAAFAVAVGVAALTGVKGFGTAFRRTLLENAKQLIAADVQGQIWAYPTGAQVNAMAALARGKGSETQVTEAVTMAGSPNQHRPQLISLKAVDPTKYPFYGELKLDPARSLANLLSSDQDAVVTPELLIRMRVHPGDTIRIAGQPFRIVGTVLFESDRLASGFGPGMRAIVTRAGLARTGIVEFGSRAAQRFLFKLNPGIDIEKFEQQLAAPFPRIYISDNRKGSPMVGEAIDTTTSFLSLITLVALIIGALGVATSIHSHIQQRMDTIGIIKAVGGRNRQLLSIYLAQTLIIGGTGALIGVLAGFGVQALFPVLMHRVVAQLPAVRPGWSFVLQGGILGVLATVLFTLPSLVGVRAIRPNLVFRRNFEALRSSRITNAVFMLLIAAGFFLLAWWTGESVRTGLYFTAGLATGIGALAGVATLLMFVARQFSNAVPVKAWIRHAFGNLYRPGAYTRSTIVAIGVGVMFVTLTYLMQAAVLHDVATQGPGREGNLFLLDVRDAQGITNLIEQQPGVRGKLQLAGYIIARMLSKNGVPPDQLQLPREMRDRAEAVRLTSAAELPDALHLKQGTWWKPGESQPMLAVSRDAARDYKIQFGDVMKFQAAGRQLEGPVVAIFEREERSPVRYDLVFPKNALAGLPVVYYGAADVSPQNIPEVEAAIFDKYPTVTIMNLADILDRVNEAVSQISLVVRFLASFAVAAGLIILGASIAGTRARRVREIAVLKTLGASKSHIRRQLILEFSLEGAAAGLIGSILATVFMKVISGRLIPVEFDVDFRTIAIAVILTVLLTDATAWATAHRMLDQKPLEVLRDE